MFRPASRLIVRSSALRPLPRVAGAPARRFLSTAPPTEKSRSWKSLAARVGAAGALIYYYNTTDVFAEEPGKSVQALPETEDENEQLPTIDAIAQARQQRAAEVAAAQKRDGAASTQQPVAEAAEGAEGLQDEADQQGAFNPETGEINWDCPCLGGMAHGPCGEEFRAAFSCFVYSTEDPKGMDCVEKFKDMQNCFRQYPEVYGSELETDEEDDVTADGALSEPIEPEGQRPEKVAPLASSEPPTGATDGKRNLDVVPESYRPKDSNTEAAEEASPEKTASNDRDLSVVPDNYRPQDSTPRERAKAAAEQVKKHEPVPEADEITPKAAHDTTDMNEGK